MTSKTVTVKKEIESIRKELLKGVEEELAPVSMTESKRNAINKLIIDALQKIPQEPIEKAPIEDDNVVCKMLLKGYPKVLLETLERLLLPLQVKNKNGYIDYGLTGQYAITVLLEKIPKKETNDTTK